MGDLQIVGLGLATLDVILRLKEMPTWQRDTRTGAISLDGGGMVGTALVAAARLGARVGYVGTVGNDGVAQLKLRSLAENGVDVSRMVVRPTPESQVIVVYVHEETGERVFSRPEGYHQNLLRVDELERDYITAADYLHLDGFHPEASLRAAQWMHEAGRKVVLDGSKTRGRLPPSLRSLIEHVDILICASGFAPALTGLHQVWEAGEAVLNMGPSVVVQTEGRDGSYTVTRDEAFHTPAFEVDVVDTTGAGDVFHGAYLVGLLRGWDLRRIAIFATAVSAITCTKLGGRAGIPSYEEVLTFLRERGIDLM